MAKCIRVLGASVPRILCEIIEDVITAEPDMEFRASSGAAPLVAEVEEAAADVVIVGDVDMQHVTALLRARSDLKILAIVAEGREAFLYQLRPERVRLREASPKILVSAIREAVDSSRSWAAGTWSDESGQEART